MQQVERWWPAQETAGARSQRRTAGAQAGKGLLKRRDGSVSQIPRAQWFGQHSSFCEAGECAGAAREQFEATVVRFPIVCVRRRWTVVVPMRMCNGIYRVFCPMARMDVALMGVAIRNRFDQHPAHQARDAW